LGGGKSKKGIVLPNTPFAEGASGANRTDH
jgi:hypothetical protein